MKKLLLNPFERFAGAESLLIGLVIITATTLIAFAGNIHLDGPIDLHEGLSITPAVCIAEAVTDWLSLVIFLYLAGLFVSRSSIRFIDILGTQAMARFPFLITALASWLLYNPRILNFIEFKLLHQGHPVELSVMDWAGFILTTVIMLTCVIWMIVLMYRSYSVSCNVKGTKGIVSFIICLLLAEIFSKLVLSLIV